MVKWLLIAFVVGVALLLWRLTAHANRNLPKAGDAAPDFSLPDQNGKVRARLTVPADLPEDELRERVFADAAVRAHTDGKTIRKVVIAKGPLVSVVVS